MGFFDKIKAGLSKTRDALNSTLGSVFSGFSEIWLLFWGILWYTTLGSENLTPYL